jgi:hypothetical protein
VAARSIFCYPKDREIQSLFKPIENKQSLDSAQHQREILSVFIVPKVMLIVGKEWLTKFTDNSQKFKSPDPLSVF